jgi:hypothetical protein
MSTTDYIATYIRYNRWYRRVTGLNEDARALDLLCRRYVIWEDYLGEGLTWKSGNWQALIREWYRVRCLLVHGDEVAEEVIVNCRRTLQAFMEEVERREKLLSDSPAWVRAIYCPNGHDVDMIPVKTLSKLFTNY